MNEEGTRPGAHQWAEGEPDVAHMMGFPAAHRDHGWEWHGPRALRREGEGQRPPQRPRAVPSLGVKCRE